MTDIKHTCNPKNPGMPLPFGRKAPKGVCVRCDDLRGGAAPRTLGWVEAKNRSNAIDARRSAELTAHFASAQHLSGGCGVVCTFGDW
jgi:hypothetical protein